MTADSQENHSVIISVGSNIHPEKYISKALKIICMQHRFIAASRFVITKPIGYLHQDDFMNGAVQLETSLSHNELKVWLKEVEKQLGRKTSQNKYGPRTIDLDIVVWDDRVVDKHVYKRDFLRNAVCELKPGLFGHSS